MAGALAFSWATLRHEARVTVSYAARVGCACRFGAGRPIGECKGAAALAGLGRTASLVMLSEDKSDQSVSASVPLLAREVATWKPETGCQLEPWRP